MTTTNNPTPQPQPATVWVICDDGKPIAWTASGSEGEAWSIFLGDYCTRSEFEAAGYFAAEYNLTPKERTT